MQGYVIPIWSVSSTRRGLFEEKHGPDMLLKKIRTPLALKDGHLSQTYLDFRRDRESISLHVSTSFNTGKRFLGFTLFLSQTRTNGYQILLGSVSCVQPGVSVPLSCSAM